MSCSAAHQSKELRRDHVLCFECYRSVRDSRRAELLSALPPPRPLSMPFGATLTQKQVAHRALMLKHLRRSAATRS